MSLPKKAVRNVENARAYVKSVRNIPAGTRISQEGYQAMLLDGAEYLPVVLAERDLLDHKVTKMRKRLEYWMETAIKLCPPGKRPWLEDVRAVDLATLGFEEEGETNGPR